MKPIIFIQSNRQQLFGALLSKYSFEASSNYPDSFDVRILNLEDFPALHKREGQTYLRKGKTAVWKNNDLQSFTLLRFLPPQLMGFEGRALIVDPDVFAIDDVFELLSVNMNGKAILCRKISKQEAKNADQISPQYTKEPTTQLSACDQIFATSVMLLDCKKLRHWQWEEQVENIFNKLLDYRDWIYLKNEDQAIIGNLGQEWNHFDTLDASTKLLHTTRRITQPWKTGLPIDFNTTTSPLNPRGIFMRTFHLALDFIGLPLNNINKFLHQGHTKFQPHPDRDLEQFIMSLIRDAMRTDAISRDFILKEIHNKNIREDMLKVIEGITDE